MKNIKEVKIGKESEFVITEVYSGITIGEYKAHIKSVVIKNRGCLKYFLYNSKYEVITDSYNYLNNNSNIVANNTKKNCLYGLKSLYTFLEIIEKDLSDLTSNDFFQLNTFLKGYSANGTDYKFSILTKRSNTTIKIFFSIYREYFRYLGLENSPLFNFKKIPKYMTSRNYVGRILKRDTTPEYISEDKFNQINNFLDNDKDILVLRNKCIIRIMYQSGLRLGEVLGLTLEDIEIRVNSDGKHDCILIIRNRLSDTDFQQAKTCMKVYDKRNYKSNDYKCKNVGYQEAIIFDFDGINTHDLLCDYIDVAHEFAERVNSKYYMKTIADQVGSFNEEHKENHYVFLNSKGGILNDESWNIALREIFVKNGVQIDKGYRQHNLSHRFRHGFVMKLLYGFGQTNLSYVKVFTRHKSDLSINAYNNPTTEDIVKLKNDIIESILEENLNRLRIESV